MCKNAKPENSCNWLDSKENGCKLSPLKDPQTGEFLGYLACSVLKTCPSCEKIKELSTRCPLNKIAYSFLWLWMVKDWRDLSEEFADHYTYRDILNYLLNLVFKDIENKEG